MPMTQAQIEAELQRRSGGICTPAEAARILFAELTYRCCLNCRHWSSFDTDETPDDQLLGVCHALAIITNPEFGCKRWAEKI
jgi:hypothetical protein